jgi:hypothetical protein
MRLSLTPSVCFHLRLRPELKRPREKSVGHPDARGCHLTANHVQELIVWTHLATNHSQVRRLYVHGCVSFTRYRGAQQ